MQELNIEKIDFLIATHPHADHIGGLPAIIEAMEIGAIFAPYVSHTTQTYERFLEAIDQKGMQIDIARSGVNILTTPGIQIDIVAPVRDDYTSLNDHSAVILITFLDTAFIFMGDAEELSESHITANISADVLKVGHHGSQTSTSEEFLNRVNPTYAVISCGRDNQHGHPHEIVLTRLNDIGAYIYRTDLQGTIIITSDGNNININTEFN
jgi:competence protein ComEC